MKRATVLLLACLAAAAAAQGPAAAPPTPASEAQLEARRAETLAEIAALAARLPERVVCALFPANARGLPAFKADSRGALSLDLTVQADLAAYRAWVAELSPRLRRLARSVETVRLVKESAGYRFELPEREFDASEFVVVDGFSDIPRTLGARVYAFDVATAAAVRAAFRPPRDKPAQTAILLEFRDEAGLVASARQPFALSPGPESVAPFVEWRVRYQRFGSGAKAAKFPVLTFKSRKPLRLSLAKVDVRSLRTMTKAWSVCLPNAAADAAAASGSETAAPFRDWRGRVLRPRAAAAAAVPAPGSAPAGAESAAAAEEAARRRAAEARALRRRAGDAAEAFFTAVRGGSRGKAAAAAVEAFEREDLSIACVEASFERPGAPDLLLSGEAYLASQLWAKWRMRATEDARGRIAPTDPVWALAPSFEPPEYIRGAARANPFPALSLEDPGETPAPVPIRTADSLGPALLAFAALLLLAATGALLWIERMRRKAEEEPDNRR